MHQPRALTPLHPARLHCSPHPSRAPGRLKDAFSGPLVVAASPGDMLKLAAGKLRDAPGAFAPLDMLVVDEASMLHFGTALAVVLRLLRPGGRLVRGRGRGGSSAVGLQPLMGGGLGEPSQGQPPMPLSPPQPTACPTLLSYLPTALRCLRATTGSWRQSQNMTLLATCAPRLCCTAPTSARTTTCGAWPRQVRAALGLESALPGCSPQPRAPAAAVPARYTVPHAPLAIAPGFTLLIPAPPNTHAHPLAHWARQVLRTWCCRS